MPSMPIWVTYAQCQAWYFLLAPTYSQHWVLRPASVTGFEIVKVNGGRYIKWISAWYSDQAVAKSNI